ncbi:MAG: cupin domain-containing protein [bacterium]
MEHTEIFKLIEQGRILYQDKKEEIKNINWEEHAKFKGVFLKHLIKGKETNNLFSSHLVKIDPNCIIDIHQHEKLIELHEVIEGSGEFSLADLNAPYHPGQMAVIPKGVDHKVIANENGLVLLAKFFPALL